MPLDEKLIQQLIELYRRGFEEILQIIITKEAKGQAISYWKDMLKEVYDILNQLDEETRKWVQQVIGQVYSQASAETWAYLNSLGMAVKENPSFAQVHQRAIDVIAQNMVSSMHESFQFIGRRVNDVFRQVALEETGRKMASGTTIKDMKQRVIQRLLDQGQTAFVDKLGRKWRLDSYAEMVARTTTREAASAATINTCREAGLDLVKITTHYPTCEKCAPLQGKVFSISGQDKRYPKLTDEYRPPIHPNCRHTLQPYIRELDPDAEKVEKYSNTSLTKDPRSEEEKQAYKEMRDAVTIATNRRRAREVLLSKNYSLQDKMEAYKLLNKTYEYTGKKPVGVDGQIIKHYQLNEDKYNVIIITENIINNGPSWKKNKDIEHLRKRKRLGQIPESWGLEEYNHKIRELCSNPNNEVYLYYKKGFKQKYYVFGDKEWIAIIGQDGIIDTAFKIDKMSYEEYIKKEGMKYMGTIKELRANGQ